MISIYMIQGIIIQAYVQRNDIETMIFQWTENNYMCDCHRSRCLYRGQPEKYLECGDYILLDKIVEHDTGKLVKECFEEF